MSECKKCIKYIECLEKFRVRKLEGYYNEVPDLTEEKYFRDIDESAGCVSYQPFTRDNGKTCLMYAIVFTNVLATRFGYIRAHYPHRRSFRLAFFSRNPRTRRKNMKRVNKWYEDALRRSWR